MTASKCSGECEETCCNDCAFCFNALLSAGGMIVCKNINSDHFCHILYFNHPVCKSFVNSGL